MSRCIQGLQEGQPGWAARRAVRKGGQKRVDNVAVGVLRGDAVEGFGG